MADDRPGQPSTPLTPDEANAYEKPIRRELYIGLLVGLAVIIVLIVTVMEVRFRTALGNPQPSAAMDSSLQQVMDRVYPLPERISFVRMSTILNAERPSYEVFLEDPEGRTRYHIGRTAETAYMPAAGPRAGQPANLEVELTLRDDGTVQGLYRQDRGVPVAHYRQLLQDLLREAMVAYEVHARFSPAFAPMEDGWPSVEQLREQWDAVMD